MCRIGTVAAIALLALSGCDAPPSAPRARAAKAERPDPAYRARLLALNPQQRNHLMFQAIAGNNGACPEVKRSAYQQSYQDMTMWVAECAISGDWAVFINNNGFAQTRSCGEEKQLGLPECRPLS